MQRSVMCPLAAAIALTWRRNRVYAERLVGDLSADKWTQQPIAHLRLNHPAWILSHLNVYTPLCTAMLRGTPFDDPIDHMFGQRSEVVNDPGVYESGPTLLAEFTRLHDVAGEALGDADAPVFARPTPLDRWRAVHPTIGDMLVTLMVKHEAGHLGQLSAWRRAMGLPRVSMG